MLELDIEYFTKKLNKKVNIATLHKMQQVGNV